MSKPTSTLAVISPAEQQQAIADVRSGQVISASEYDTRQRIAVLMSDIRAHGYNLSRSRYAIGLALHEVHGLVSPVQFRRILEDDLGGMSRQVAANYMRVVEFGEQYPQLKDMAEGSWQKVLELCNGAEKEELNLIMEGKHEGITMDRLDAASSRQVRKMLKDERKLREKIIDAEVDVRTKELREQLQEEQASNKAHKRELALLNKEPKASLADARAKVVALTATAIELRKAFVAVDQALLAITADDTLDRDELIDVDLAVESAAQTAADIASRWALSYLVSPDEDLSGDDAADPT